MIDEVAKVFGQSARSHEDDGPVVRLLVVVFQERPFRLTIDGIVRNAQRALNMAASVRLVRSSDKFKIKPKLFLKAN